MNKIQMVDLGGQYRKIKQDIDAEIQAVIDSTAFIKGGKVTEFSGHLEKYLGVKHVIPVGNGTDALQIALMSLGLKPGDEVITPVFTFIATVEVIALLGLKPVFVDVDKESFNINVESFKKAITPATKAVVPVHLFGQNACMEEVLRIAEEHNIYVVEDACQSIGAEYVFSNGTKLKSGCIGHIGCTSFFPSKNLGCFGDGGALFTDSDELAEQIKAISNHGMKVRYHHDFVGVNSRLDSIQAAVLDVKLRYLDEYNKARQTAAAFYDNAFSGNDKIIIPGRHEYSTHVFHQYTLLLKNCEDRDVLRKYLEDKGIPSMIYYPVPLHLQKAYAYLGYGQGDFPVSEYLANHVLSLPMHTELSEDQLEYITKAVLDFFK
jgi:dTDP-4-amino-4,6-dideoxygalactose transaminase